MNRRRFFTTQPSGPSPMAQPDWYYHATDLDGTQDLVDSGIKLFGTENTTWTLFYYVDDFPTSETRTQTNVGGIYNGGTVFTVTASRYGNGLGYGTLIKYAQNNGYVFDKKQKTFVESSNDQRTTGYACPIAIRRSGDTFTYSVDGTTYVHLMDGYYTGNANSTLTVGLNAWNGNFRPTIDGDIEVAIWLDDSVDISSYFLKYQ